MMDTIMKPLEGAFKPVSELISINAKALEKLAEQQTVLFTDMLKVGVSYSEGVTSIKDLSGFVEAQKSFAEEVQSKVVTAAKDAYAVATTTSEETGEVFKGAFETVKAAAPKPAAAPKAAAKSAK